MRQPAQKREPFLRAERRRQLKILPAIVYAYPWPDHRLLIEPLIRFCKESFLEIHDLISRLDGPSRSEPFQEGCDYVGIIHDD